MVARIVESGLNQHYVDLPENYRPRSSLDLVYNLLIRICAVDNTSHDLIVYRGLDDWIVTRFKRTETTLED